MNTVVAVCALSALPAAWFAGVLLDRVPDRLPLFDPLPRPRFSGAYASLYVLTIGLFVAGALRFGDGKSAVLATYLVAFAAFVALSAIDLDVLRLPDQIVIPLLMLSIAMITVASVVAKNTPSIRFALLGGALYFGFLLLAHLAFPRGMGFGDVKLAAVMGLYVGWLGNDLLTSAVIVLYAMIVGFVVGSMVGIVLFAFRRKSKPIPFGPFLMFGTIVVIFVSDQLLPAPVF